MGKLGMGNPNLLSVLDRNGFFDYFRIRETRGFRDIGPRRPIKGYSPSRVDQRAHFLLRDCCFLCPGGGLAKVLAKFNVMSICHLLRLNLTTSKLFRNMLCSIMFEFLLLSLCILCYAQSI
jgi:hypothetical protein